MAEENTLSPRLRNVLDSLLPLSQNGTTLVTFLRTIRVCLIFRELLNRTQLEPTYSEELSK